MRCSKIPFITRVLSAKADAIKVFSVKKILETSFVAMSHVTKLLVDKGFKDKGHTHLLSIYLNLSNTWAYYSRKTVIIVRLND